MNHEIRLENRLEQRLTPQLLLNLKILILNNLELETLIQAELEKNPALEVTTESPEEEIPTEKENKNEFDVTDFLNEDVYQPWFEQESLEDTADTTYTSQISIEESLLPIIKSQVSENEFPVVEYIIGNLNENGFLTIPLQEIGNKFNITLEELKVIINKICSIEPGGIAAPNLQQALLCQLQILGFDENSNEYKLIRDYYDLLLKHQYAKIAKALEIDESTLTAVVININGLDTRPIRRYQISATDYVVPDFSISWVDDNLVGSAYDETMPVLRISPRYREMVLHPKDFSVEEVHFAREKVRNAIMLIKGIESRKQTLRNIVQFIISKQREFFIKGKEYIKPISMTEAAAVLGIHGSTLSRACQGKYVDTPVGVFPLRFFFTSGFGEHSRHSIKERIQSLISEEDKSKPYTDDEIVALLAQQNIKLSRRTVAKYREELKIPGSSERKFNNNF